MVVRIQRNRLSHTFLVVMQNGAATLDNCLAVLYKPKYTVYPRENINLSPHKNLYTNVQGKFICICQRPEQPKCPSTNERLNKRWYIYTMEYSSAMQKSSLWLYTS